ncbi:hypothetical protein INT45_008889 [Circinella minor]|uniref:Cation efflux protein cytoplasmic domain-containing protein n=1 Tax=Circinella minor TaxID=1195481 RepID=A0A8H7RYL9_9FUNG|nr:hypothetical protein INT45_008889 [Circinella minor]
MTTTSTQTIELRETSISLNGDNNGLQHRNPISIGSSSIGTISTDMERGPDQRLIDPLRLRSAKKSEKDIKQMQTTRKVRKFYRKQNDLIDHILGPLNPINEDEEQRQMLKVKIAVYGSGIANIILFVLQLIAAISSESLAIFATMADAFMDLLSSIVMMWAARQVSKPNLTKYPAGKDRMETAAIMIEAAQKLAEPQSITPNMTTVAIGCVATAIGVKFCLYLYCVSLSQYSSAKVFAQDHRNDLLVNGLGIVTGILGSRLAGWVDAAGSIIIALIILQSWSFTLFEHTKLIVGKSADNDFLKRATYIALTHPGVHQVDTCRAYYAGNNLFVEVDIVLPPDTQLRDSHDIGESLQIKLESLPQVERAFVHVDYETSHRPEHQKSK